MVVRGIEMEGEKGIERARAVLGKERRKKKVLDLKNEEEDEEEERERAKVQIILCDADIQMAKQAE